MAFALFLGVGLGSSWAQAPRHVRGRLLVKFRADTRPDKVRGTLAALQTQEEGEIPGIGVKVLSLPPNASETALEHAFRGRAEVEFAEVDRILPPDSVTPNDPLYSSQWHLPRVAAPDAWSVTRGNSGIIIAILDTGVDGTHPDLASKMVAGWNIYDNSPDTSDVYGHGTKVAGTAAAYGNNGTGVASLAWDCLIMPVRISAADGYATYSAIASGLMWAADHGARVANISYMVTTSSTVKTAAKYFSDKGGVVTSSAGNYATFDSSADNPYILTVSGTDESDALYSWSNTGNNVDLAAPGCAGATTTVGGGYSDACGTSFSAPIVAGVAALVLSQNPALTPAQVTSILRESADDRGPAGWDPSYGYGRVNAARAVGAGGSGSDTEAPSVTIASPANGTTVSGQVSVQVTATDNVGVASVNLYVDGALSATDSTFPYSFAWDSTQAANGAHVLEARVTDAAENSSSSAVSVTVSNTVADIQAPAIAITSPTGGATVSGNVSVTCGASDNVGVTSVGLYVDGVLSGTDTSSPYSFAWNTTTATNSVHTLLAKASDAAGNTSSSAVSVTVSNTVADTQAPAIAITSPAGGATVSGNVSITCSASDNVGVTSVSLYVDGVLSGTDTSSPYSFAWDATTTTNSVHTLLARASDAAGNTSSSAVSVTVSNAVADTQAPGVAITSPTSGATVSGNVSVTCGASDNVGVTSVSLYVDGILSGTDTSSPYSFAWNTTTATNSVHTLLAKASDAAGNTSSSTVSLTVSNVAADTQAPAIAITSPADGTSVSRTVNVRCAATDNVRVVKVELYVDGVRTGSSSSAPFTIGWDSKKASRGGHVLLERAYDAAGNVGVSTPVTVYR